MKKKLQCIGSSILITVSFVLGIGLISSVAMIIINDSLTHVVLISGIAQGIYFAFVILFFKIKKVKIKNTYGIKSVPYYEYLLPITVAFCFSAFSNIVQSVVTIPEILIGGIADDMGENIVFVILSIFIVAPIVEEVVFRAIIMTKLRQKFSIMFSIIISAILFAIIHFMAGGMIMVIHAFFGGLIFALVYTKTKSLLPAIAAHIFGNIGGFVPKVTNNFSLPIQNVVATCFFIITIVLVILLIYKKEKKYSE